ncbi:MAG: hypothetical protein HYR80_03185, partial [Nitrospirae bacterium]|nr:hypothetical protein [Nitrospirota bacterium]
MKISKIKTSLPGGWRWGAGSLLIFWLILTGLSLTAHASLIGNAIQVDTLTGNDDNASMAFDGANYLVSWQNSSGTSSSIDIYGKVFDSNGNLIVAPFAINASTNDQIFPSVANYAAGQFLVVYQSFNGTDQDIIGTFVSYSATNAVMGTTFTIAGGAGNQQVPSIAYDGTNFYVAYLDGGTSVRAISVTKTGVVGTAVTVATVTSNATPPSVLPQITFSNTTVGRYLIAWEDFGTDPSGNVYGNTITTAGAIGTVTGVAVTSGLAERNPSVAFDGTNFLVVYDTGASGVRDIYGQLITTGGTLSGSRFAISTAINDQLLPKVTYSTGAGLYFASWQDYRNSTSIADIYGARILRTGSVVESAGMVVNSNTTFQKQSPVSGNDGTNFFALWTDFRNPPSGSDIWSQKSEGPPPVLSSVTPSVNLTVGVPMTLTGNYFGDLAAGSRSTSTDYVMINGLKVSDAYFSSWMNNLISFSLPPNSNSGAVQVYSGNLGSNTISLSVQDF